MNSEVTAPVKSALTLVPPSDPILREAMPKFDFLEKPIDPIALYNDMASFLIAQDGLGLSANQVGIRANFCVIRGEKVLGMFNPKIVDTSEAETFLEEGCLSFPGIWLRIKRPRFIRVRFTHPNGLVETRKFADLTARVIQHECDHLNGVLFSRKVSSTQVEMAIKRAKKVGNLYRKADVL